MSLWRQLKRGIQALANRGAANQAVVDEVADYLERATADHLARGRSPAEARRAARLELGSTMGVEEQIRDYGWENLMETIFSDARYAARRLRKAPGFTAVAVLTLALGIGATTAIFSAVNPILFQSLPYPQAGRMVAVVEQHKDGGRSQNTFALYRQFTERARSFDAIAVFRPWQPAVTGAAQPERLRGQRVTQGFFRALGVAPVVGRDFQAPEDQFHGPRVVILSDVLWRRRFAASRGIIGQQVELDGDGFLVIGVMPADFEDVLDPSAELWAPLQYDALLPNPSGREWGHHLGAIARLLPGVSLDQASREVNAVGRAFVAAQLPETYDPNTQFGVVSLQGDLTRGVRPALLAILAAVVLVLVIACVNVTNLVLARGAGRHGEMAVRAALGAGRRRLVRQLLTESLLLAGLGGTAGMGVAVLGVRTLVALSPAGLPRVGTISLSGPVLLFGFVVTTLIGLAFGLTPALHASRHAPQEDLQQGSRRSTGGNRRVRNGLVVAEVALALVLLVNAGLLLRSIERLFAVPAGFEASHLLTMQVQEAGHRYDADSARARFFADALDAVHRVPGVTTAAFTSQLPLSGDMDTYGAKFEMTPTLPAATYGAFRYAVSPGYLEMMRIPLKAGRLLDEHDRAGTPLVAVISEALAKVRFPKESPLGQHVRLGGSNEAPPYTIVGVVGDVRQQSLALSDAEAVYIPATQWRWMDNTMSLVVRARGDEAMAAAVRQAIWSADRDQPVTRVAMMDALLAATASQRRFALILFECFALAALVLAAAGIYGVLAGSVAERTREIGVRSALGASPGDIVGLVLRQGMTLTMLGQVIGLAGAMVATGWIVTLLWNVSRLDPLTYAGVIVLLTGVAVLACLVPAWRAARVDPATTLRAE